MHPVHIRYRLTDSRTQIIAVLFCLTLLRPLLCIFLISVRLKPEGIICTCATLSPRIRNENPSLRLKHCTLCLSSDLGCTPIFWSKEAPCDSEGEFNKFCNRILSIQGLFQSPAQAYSILNFEGNNIAYFVLYMPF